MDTLSDAISEYNFRLRDIENYEIKAKEIRIYIDNVKKGIPDLKRKVQIECGKVGHNYSDETLLNVKIGEETTVYDNEDDGTISSLVSRPHKPVIHPVFKKMFSKTCSVCEHEVRRDAKEETVWK